MMKSMTAFGRAKQTVRGKDITVEIRGVNNRFFDCGVRLPRAYSCLEEKIKPYLQSRGISRGKVDVSVSVELPESADVSVTLDVAYARGYLDALHRLRDEFGLADDISVMSVARNTDLFKIQKKEEDTDRDWEDLLAVLAPAADGFLAGRAAEGKRIAADLTAKIDGIRAITGQIAVLSERNIGGYRDKLRERLTQVLADNKITVDENRLLTECAIFADRVAVDEELVRLGSHFKAFDDIAASGEPAGRKLDFLVQEMNREINTIGSKCSDSDTAHLVVAVKNELEKIREQIQNIE